MKYPSAHIIAIGSELLHGGRVDSNSLFIADVLAQCGVEVKQKAAIGDHPEEIRSLLVSSAKRVEVIVTTGGLGSTLDDCTREAFAAAFGRKLRLRQKALEMVRAQLHKRGRPVTPLIARQALLPAGATILDNSVGTAPGFYLQVGKTHLFILPGVPREAREMARVHIPVLLHKKLMSNGRLFWTHSFNTFGIAETDVQGHLMPLLKNYPSIRIGLLASTKGVKVTLSCWRIEKSGRPGSKRLGSFPEGTELGKHIQSVLGPWLFAEGEEEIEEVVGRLLASRSFTLAVAESCTGGLVTHRLTEIPGSSAYVDRGIVSYSNQAKQQLLGVRPSVLRQFGAVSLQVAQAMATGIKKGSGVDIGLSITGIAGPGGGSKSKPVGMVCMAIDGPWGAQARQFQFWGNRSEIKFRSSQAALNLVRGYIVNGEK
ncbi:MAG: CinA family nicotinamide mononucleotide deamidase-related protein [Nitrospirales bacterium]|nr:CinA family nicotinamide mononucleotide deamidase-related protein [Nitrospirales bacterium]